MVHLLILVCSFQWYVLFLCLAKLYRNCAIRDKDLLIPDLVREIKFDPAYVFERIQDSFPCPEPSHLSFVRRKVFVAPKSTGRVALQRSPHNALDSCRTLVDTKLTSHEVFIISSVLWLQCLRASHFRLLSPRWFGQQLDTNLVLHEVIVIAFQFR